MSVPIETPDLKGASFQLARMSPYSLARAADGKWSLTLDAGVAVRLEDGREILFAGAVRLWGKQVGRKPRAAETKPRGKRGKP